MPVPPRHPALNFVGGVIVLVAAVSARFWYLESHGFESDAPRVVWQVQGQDFIMRPPGTTEVDSIVHNLQTQGSPKGLRGPQPFGPKEAVQGNDQPPAPVDEPLADRGPLYPLFRFYIEWARDEYLDYFQMNGHAAVRMAQVALGGLTCLLYFVITLRAFGNHFLLALLVGLATAAYPFWVINVGELEDGTLTSFLLAWALAVGVKIGQKGGVVRSYLYGLLLAALVLTRAALLPFAIVGLLWFFLRCRRVPNGGLCALLTVIGFASGVTPWVLWTAQQHGEPIPVASSAWFHLWVGSDDLADQIADGTPYPVWVLEKGERVPPDVLAKMQQTPLPHRYEHLAPIVMERIKKNPVNFLNRRIRAIAHFFLGMRNPKQLNIQPGLSVVRIPEYLPPLLYLCLFGMFFFAVLGWRWTYGWRYLSAPLTLAIYWIPLPYLLSHAGPLHTARLPLDGVFIILAVVGIVGLLPGVGARLLAGEDRPVTK